MTHVRLTAGIWALGALLLCGQSGEAASICGLIRAGADNRPVGDVAISLDGNVVGRSDAAGRFSIELFPDARAEFAGTIVAVSGNRIRTRVIRITSAWLAGPVAGNSGCIPLDLGVERPSSDQERSIDAKTVLGESPVDVDGDQIDDKIEDWLAERFAPELYHDKNETAFPVSVDWWLTRTHLAVTGGTGRTRRVLQGPLTQQQLLGQLAKAADGTSLTSDGTRSRVKAATFFLEDVPPAFRIGAKGDPKEWVTYVHSFGNTSGGITLQYWRAYAWNPASVLIVDFGHGGDWEGIAVHLDAALVPAKVTFLGHAGIGHEREGVEWRGTHPVVWSEAGGHSSAPRSASRSMEPIRQQTWTGGNAGGLVNVGEKELPRNGQVFISYSGLWGAPGALFLTSGYWGPAFNETDARCSDGRRAYSGLRHNAASPDCGQIYMTAWCDGMDGRLLNLQRECYARHESR